MQELNVIDARRAIVTDVSRKRMLEMSKTLSNIVANHTPELSDADHLIEDLHLIADGVLQMNRRKNWFWEPLVGLVPGMVDRHGDKLIAEVSSTVTAPILSGLKRVLTQKTFSSALDSAETHPLGDRDIPSMASNLLAAIDQWFEKVESLDDLNFGALQEAFMDRSVLRDMRIVTDFVTKTTNSGLPKNSEFGSMLSEIVKNSTNHG